MSEELAGVPAVDVRRGERVESVHAVAACACTPDGDVRYAKGTIDVPVFLRSSAKPFIAAAVVAAGAVERFAFAPHEIAMMAASHEGEPEHVATVAGMLAKIGASESDLRCGSPAPGLDQLHHNCSGKHAGILALARLLDAPLPSYLSAGHPAERAILALCERAFRDRFTPDRIAVDGCGIPAIATSLRNAAAGYARLATLSGLTNDDRAALATVRAAMLAHPWFVAGTGRFDTDLMVAGGTAFVSKSGAEGVQAVGSLGAGFGLVLKVVDGARRAAAPAMLDALAALGALDERLAADLAGHLRVPVRNTVGQIVGIVAPRKPAATRSGAAGSMPA